MHNIIIGNLLRVRRRRGCLGVILVFILLFLFLSLEKNEDYYSKLSVLGRRLYLGNTLQAAKTERNFTILVWRHGQRLERRLIYRYTDHRYDPFGNCSVSNCELTYDHNDISRADAILFHLHLTQSPLDLPLASRLTSQRWVFLTDENPYHTFMFLDKTYSFLDFNGMFNWSMTYRSDSDVPVPYGRTLPISSRNSVQINPKNNHSKLVAIMGSNCNGKNNRWSYVDELQRHIPVDIYGSCGTLRCPGHYGSDCPLLDNYMFYLAFENGNCREYITEKAWWNAYHKGAVPIIMGMPSSDCIKLLPPFSYIHVDEFDSPFSLAQYLLELNKSRSDYQRYFSWRLYYTIVNEHGYFQTPVYHYCRLCEALNYNDPTPKVYQHLELFWNAHLDCR